MRQRHLTILCFILLLSVSSGFVGCTTSEISQRPVTSYSVPAEDAYVFPEVKESELEKEYDLLQNNAVSVTSSDFILEPYQDGVAIASYKGSSLNIRIPDSLDGQNVLLIKKEAFKDCPGMETLIIESTNLSLETGVLSGCESLKLLQVPGFAEGDCIASLFGKTDWTFNRPSVPSTLKYIVYTGDTLGDHAMAECHQLKLAVLTEHVKTIGSAALFGCRELEILRLDHGILEIGNYAFLNCASLEKMTIPDSVEKIGFGILQNCSKLTSLSIPYLGSGEEAVPDEDYLSYDFGASSYAFPNYIPNTLTRVILTKGREIAPYAFHSCQYLREIILPESLEKIDERAFYMCTRLRSVKIPDGATEIGKGAFAHCERLSRVVLPATLTKLDIQAFHMCFSLKEITIPDSLSEIGNSAFSECISLTKVILPQNITIGSDAFYHTPFEDSSRSSET